MNGIFSRIHDKAIHMYLQDRLVNINSIQLSAMNTGFGNHVLLISGKDFSINPCHITKMDALPYRAKYKLKAAMSNPDNHYDQLNIFTPPTAQDYLNVYFVITLFFNGATAVPYLALPNNNFTTILDRKPILSVVETEEESTYQERKTATLISEVKKEYEQRD